MAHIQTSHLGLWKPQDLVTDKISSQKMFIDNIDALEEFAISVLKRSAIPVASITELRAINTSDTAIYTDSTTVMVKSNGLYFFDRGNSSADNGSTIIAPTTGGGRWISINTFFGSLAFKSSLSKSDVGLGNVPNVATNDQTPTYTQATTLTNLSSGEKLSVSFGKIMKAITDLISHLANKSNPHAVTKAQVGLGSVPNVATNDQTPTYTQATTLANLVSGEKLSVSFGKIMKGLADLISHLANKSNPHAVTKAQVGLGNVDNTSDANKPISTATQAALSAINSNLCGSVLSLPDLRAIDTSNTALFKNGTLIMVQENGIYVFNRSSTADDDNNAIIAPTTGGGRWITAQGTDIALSPRYINSIAELDALLTTVITQMSPNSVKFLVVRGLGGTEPPLYGGSGHVTIYKTDNSYATVTMIIYNNDKIALYYTRTRYDGVWGRWVTLPYLDVNGKIPISQLPSGIMSASVE